MTEISRLLTSPRLPGAGECEPKSLPAIVATRGPNGPEWRRAKANAQTDMSQVPPFPAASRTRSLLKTGDAVAEEQPFMPSNPKFDGMGRGLAICSPIVDAQEGRLWVSPNHPEGLTFQFIRHCETATSADLLHECNANHFECCRSTVVLATCAAARFLPAICWQEGLTTNDEKLTRTRIGRAHR